MNEFVDVTIATRVGYMNNTWFLKELRKPDGGEIQHERLIYTEGK